MLSNAASPQQHAKQQSLPTKRRAMVPKQLNFLERRPPETYVWERLDPERRNIIIEVLSRLIAKAALANFTQEQTDDRYHQDQTNSSTESSRGLCASVHHLPSGAAPGVSTRWPSEPNNSVGPKSK
jgi:hypothetical protein